MIELQNVSWQVDEFSLTGVNCAVQDGDYAVLMGPTGCGKTLLAETLEVPKSRLRIIRGHGSREKTVQVALITPDDVERALKAYRD